jgi:redox-sensitive bicupin YhaK (pirin superfamily)
MVILRESERRGHTKIGWLDSKHSFSFGDYYDPRNMGFRSLRVINEDKVAPAQGFGRHPHRDMEIISYVLDGALEHKDSLGTGSVIRPGDVQRMSAGTGVTHSEWNGSKDAPVHFLQIWLMPEKNGLPASYEQKHFEPEDSKDRLRLVASRDGRDGSVRINQDASLYVARPSARVEVAHELAAGRHAWVQVARGEVKIGDQILRAGDGAAISDERRVAVQALQDAELLLFDLA